MRTILVTAVAFALSGNARAADGGSDGGTDAGVDTDTGTDSGGDYWVDGYCPGFDSEAEWWVPASVDCHGITYQGCCDDSGNAVWCDADVLYCNPCSTNADTPYCSWDPTNYYWCTEEDNGPDPDGIYPESCSAVDTDTGADADTDGDTDADADADADADTDADGDTDADSGLDSGTGATTGSGCGCETVGARSTLSTAIGLLLDL